MAAMEDEPKAAEEVVHIENGLKDKPTHPETELGKGRVQLIEDDVVRRIPIPSNDPNDPLRYSKWKKMGIIVTCCWYSIFSLILVGGLGPFLEVFFEIYPGKSTQAVVELTTLPSLVMAAGSLWLLPIALAIGRRPIFIFCVLLLLGSTIGAAVSHTYSAHMACRLLQGIATGSTESLLPLIITDITYLDERGFWFGVYWATQSIVNSVFLIANSYLVAAAGWRWFYGFLAITCGLGFALIFFLAPETRFTRSPTALAGQVIATDEFGVTHFLTDEEARERFGDVQEITDTPTAPRSYAQSLKLMQPIPANALKVFGKAYLKIMQACVSPGVIFATLFSSISLGIGIAMSLTYSTLLTGPYGWSASSVGNFNICIIVVGFGAMFYAGYIGDKLNIFWAKRNGGVHIAEHHLINLIVPFIFGVVGIVIYGVTAGDPHKYSVWGLIMGWALFEASFIAVLIISTTYGAEALPKNPGPAMVVVVGGKNIISFGASYGLTPMVERYGYREAFMILLGIFIGIFVLGSVSVVITNLIKNRQRKRSTQTFAAH